MRMNISSERKKEENCVVGGWRKLKQIKTSGEEKRSRRLVDDK